MEGLKTWLIDAFPNLTEDRIVSVLEELENNGCHTVEDLTYVDCDIDLASVLRPVERRKLAAKIAMNAQPSTCKCASYLLLQIQVFLFYLLKRLMYIGKYYKNIRSVAQC
jgi:hypothetical protein